jgi:hypothetical protein
MVISENALLKGDIRIDAAVTGDLTKTIPELVSMKVLPSEFIQPNSTLIIPVTLRTGELKDILSRHPQASLEIEFTLYFDAVTLADGTVANRLEDIEPITVKVERPAINITPQFLRSRMSSLKRSRQSQLTAELFAGLLIEQQLMAGREPLYKFSYADWMPDMLKSGLIYSLTSDDWTDRLHTMYTIIDLPLDFELIEPISENLNSEYWPARIMAIYLLAGNQNPAFTRVLNHIAQYDQHDLVRDMAVSLGANPPQN